jgi:hypothetical protein
MLPHGIPQVTYFARTLRVAALISMVTRFPTMIFILKLHCIGNHNELPQLNLKMNIVHHHQNAQKEREIVMLTVIAKVT